MSSSVGAMIKRLLFGAEDTAAEAETDARREKLTEARTKLEEETDALQKDMDRLSRRSADPIRDVVKNILRVRKDE